MSFTRKILALMLMLSPSFAYGSGAESFTYQGYITDLAEAPVVSTSVNFTFQILDPTSSCVLYEESQNGVVTDNKGMVSLRVGSPPGDPKRSASPIDGGLTMSSIFVNGALVRGAAANCAGGYTSTFGDVRILRVKVNGSALAPDTVLNAAPRAVVAETLEGIPASGFIQAGGNVTQGNLNSLTGAGDIGGTLHNHDGRYLSLGGAATHDLGTGNSYISGGAGKFGVGITAPNADIDIERSSPVLRIGSTTNAGNNSKLEFYGNNGATNTASIQSKDNANVLNFYTGGVQAMGIDSSQNVIFGASVSVTGTIGLGKYSTAQEGAIGTPGTLLFALNALGASATGTTWVNSTTNILRYWDGSAAQSIASAGGPTVTANRAVVSNGSGNLIAATTTDTEVGYLAGANVTNGGIIYGNGSAFRASAAGVAGQVLTSAGAASPTWTNSTNTNTASAIVQRNGSGDFAAGTITANLTGAASLNVLKAGDTMTGTINLRASTVAAGTAPLKMATGTLMATPEAGAIEFDGNNLYYTTSVGSRQTLGVSGGGVSTFNGRSGVVAPVANDYTWAQVDKTTSSFADITTRSATDINAGTLADGRLSANIPLKNAANIFSMGGQQINSSAVGEVPLTLKGFAAQTANLLEIKDSANTVLYSIEETGIPSAASDLTNKSYVDTAASTAGGLYIKKDGSVPLTGDWAVGTHKLTGLTDPSSAQDAATKNYVDGQTTLSSLKDAAATNTIANANFAQTWNWNTLTTQAAMNLASTSMTTGSLLSLTSSNSATTGTVFSIGASSTGAVSNGLVRFNFTGAHTGNGLQVDDVTTSGNAVTINANAATTGKALSVNGNALTSGSLVNVASTSTAASANNQTLFNVALSGANGTATQTTYGAQFANTHTGITSTNIALYATASGGSNNYAAIFNAGNVGIGTTTPTAKLHLPASTTAVGSAPLKIATGTLMTTAEAGAIEFDGTNLYFTDSGNTRRTLGTAGGAVALSALGNATGTNTLANANNAQTWNWDTLSTQAAVTMASTSLTTGSILTLSSSNTATTGTVLSVGAASTGVAANGLARFNFSGAHTGNGLQVDDVTTTGNAVAINANAATTGKALAVSGNGLTSGSLVNLASTSTAAAANTQTLLNVALSGANGTATQTTYGAQFANTHTGTTSTNVALYATASGGSNNYAAVFNAGNVGIGTVAPGAPLDVQANYSTAIAASQRAASILPIYSIADTGAKAGISTGAIASHTSGTIANMTGIASGISATGSGGTVSTATNYSAANTVTSGATMTNSIGLAVSDGTGAGNIVNQYGLYVNALTKGSTENFAVYTNGSTKSYFGGDVGIGTPSPSGKLEISTSGFAPLVVRNTNASNWAEMTFINNSSNALYVGLGGTTASGFADQGYMYTLGAQPLHLGTNALPRVTIDSAGKVGIGTTNPQSGLDVATTGSGGSAIIVPRDTTANRPSPLYNGMVRYNTTIALFEFYQNGAWVNYTTVSDARLKTNVVPVRDALETVNQLKPVYFDWDQNNPRAQSFGTKHQLGFLAQDVEKVLPEVVNQGEDTYRTIEYGKMVSVAIAAIKELYVKVTSQDEELSNLKNQVQRIPALENENSHLKQENAAIKAYLCGKDPNASICK